MATKKTAKAASAPTPSAGTSVAVRKPAAGAIVSIKEQMAAQIADLANRTAAPSGNKIRVTQDKQFVLPDGVKTPGPLQLVIVDFAASNSFYDRPFDKDDVIPPACYSVGLDPRKLIPVAASPDKQCDNCHACPNNAFGSKGKGKACTNNRLLAVLPPDGDADSPLWQLSVSPTALKAFDGYVQAVARTFQTPPVGVVTTVSFDPNNDYPSLQFGDPQPNENLAEHFARQAEAREMLMADKDFSAYEPVVKAPARKTGTARR